MTEEQRIASTLGATTAASTKPPAANKKQTKGPPPGLVIPPPKPKLTKAERRALQEQQRAEKAAKQPPQAPQPSGGAGKVAGPTTNPATPAVVVAAAATGVVLPANNTAAPTLQQQKQPTASKKGGGGGSPSTTTSGKPQSKKSATTTTTTSSSSSSSSTTSFSLVSHLPPYRNPDEIFDTGAVLTTKNKSLSSHLHPAVIELGYAYATGAITGGNARCRAMLQCYAHVLADYNNNDNDAASVVVDDWRHVVDHQILKPAFQFWTETCRPHSVSMGNAFSFLKTAVAALDRDLPWPAMVATLLETMAAYSRERIEYADVAIAETACQKLLSDDTTEVLLTYGHSEAVSAILQHASALGKKFRVIVVEEPPPRNAGRQLRLPTKTTTADATTTVLPNDNNNNCTTTYIDLSALTYVLPQVSKVLLGAAALMSDGSVVGRVGTAVVALAADSHFIPVLVCAETYKISNRVQLESITSNELGRTARRWTSAPPPPQENWMELNLLFDLTPASFVSGIVTELGLVPASSVAVLLREMNPQELKNRQ